MHPYKTFELKLAVQLGCTNSSILFSPRNFELSDFYTRSTGFTLIVSVPHLHPFQLQDIAVERQAGLSYTWELSETILWDEVILCSLRESVLQQVVSENNDYCAYACQPPKLLQASCQHLLESRPLSVRQPNTCMRNVRDLNDIAGKRSHCSVFDFAKTGNIHHPLEESF